MNERELKFRIYSFTDKLWHHFNIYEGYPQGIYGAVTPPQQFTGLKDKNKKEIYEGDIIKAYHTDFEEEVIEPIKWNDRGCWSLGRYWKDGVHDWYSVEQYCWTELEIVGNIFENPELLT